MNLNNIKPLEFNRILEECAEFAKTKEGKQKILELSPILSESELIRALRETSQARTFLDLLGTPPASELKQLRDLFGKAEKEGLLNPEELIEIADFLNYTERMISYLERGKNIQLALAYFSDELYPIVDLKDKIRAVIRNFEVDDYASPLLGKIRNSILINKEKQRKKADELLRTQKSHLTDQLIVTRNGQLCLPVKKEFKNRISGTIHGISATGATIYIEPTALIIYSVEIAGLELEEENEVKRILYETTGEVLSQIELLKENYNTLLKLDYFFAKGLYSQKIGGIEPEINMRQEIVIEKGRHPLLKKESCIPLDLKLSEKEKGFIITGPNTGGKTVVLKTVGLFSLMFQSGLHIPCKSSSFSMFDNVLCDIGDGQDVSNDLSTFSSHINNILNILAVMGEQSLVLLDELGAGTDPAEGMGIAIAILEELRVKNVKFLTTTHYPEVKHYGEETPGVINGRMTFDDTTLRPLYHLEMGKSGESCALEIARKLGMPPHMLIIAAKEAGRKNDDYKTDDFLIKESISSRTNFEHPLLEAKEQIRIGSKRAESFQLGDCVMVYPQKRTGIICRTADSNGFLQVQFGKDKVSVRHKRVKLYIRAEQLYPQDYDFSIVFDSVENRKLKRKMERKYCEGASREVSE